MGYINRRNKRLAEAVNAPPEPPKRKLREGIDTEELKRVFGEKS